MDFCCNKTNKCFDSEQSLLNHLRKQYQGIDFREVYLIENKLNKPDNNCVICGNETKFISFVRGYRDTCSSKCNTILNKKRGTFRKNINKEYEKYILNNKKFYEDNFLKTHVYDPFFKKEISRKIRHFIKQNTSDEFYEKFIREEKICSVCGEIYYIKDKFINNRKIDNVCGNKKCVIRKRNNDKRKRLKFKKSISNNQVNFLYQNLIRTIKNKKEVVKDITNEYNIDKNILLSFVFVDGDDLSIIKFEDGFPFPLVKSKNKKSRQNFASIKRYCDYFNLNIKDFIKKSFPEMIHTFYCKTCGKTIEIIDYNLIGKENFERFYCSSHCQAINKERKKKQSITMKEKIQNGEFTPCVTNSWCNSRVKIKSCSYPFRSSWECIFWLLNNNCKYEDLRLPYIDEYGDDRIYITDFIDYENKILYEIKPKCNLDNDNIKNKEKYATKWCLINGYRYVIITEDYFLENIDRVKKLKDIHYKVDNTIKAFIKINGDNDEV